MHGREKCENYRWQTAQIMGLTKLILGVDMQIRAQWKDESIS